MNSTVPANDGTIDAPRELREHDWLDRYSSGRQDLVRQFFLPALARATRYDRATGYFRSSIYSLVAEGVADFVGRGGRIRLLCSPELAEEDILAIRQGLDVRDAIDAAATRELDTILRHPLSAEPVELLANLVAAHVLEIRFAVNERGSGIFHDKVGVISDRSSAISFSGSINESWQGWHPYGNHESFEVFRDWQETTRVSAHREYFESLWNGHEDGVAVHHAPDAFTKKLLAISAAEPNARLSELDAHNAAPKRRLFDHQRDALACWVARGRRGVLKHATGSGKTLTALNAIRDWLADGKPALVLVPSRLLLDQWAAEARTELANQDPSVLLAGDGHNAWRSGGMLRLHTQPRGGPRLVIATMQTASSDEFLNALGDPRDLLVVADEAHRLGSGTFQRCMTIDAPARLALSATPERAGDPDGTQAIFGYFGDVLDPVFTLADAIEAGRLTPYVYSTTIVTLDADETQDWLDRTLKIRQIYAQEAGNEGSSHVPSGYLKNLLIQRARIAKSAGAKTQAACDVVRRDYRPGQHWLLYCSDQQQLRSVMQALADEGIETLEYHSAMLGDQDATLSHYRRAGGVLVSIKCLDEGIDIPDISHAVILASSRNPREFIQRRGRVLRVKDGKDIAHVHDLIVVPPPGEGDAFDGLVMGEIARAHEFATGANNPDAALGLHRLCVELGVDPEVLSNLGDEGDTPHDA